MPITPTPNCRILIHMRWPIEGGSTRLTPEALRQLTPYTTRYAETLGVLVHAVGGTEDHLHVLAEVPPTHILEDFRHELQLSLRRFIEGALALPGFAWSETGCAYASVSPKELEELAAYIRDNAARHAAGTTLPEQEGDEAGEGEVEETEALPDWLREAMSQGKKPE